MNTPSSNSSSMGIIMTAATKYGVPAALLSYLVWQMANTLPMIQASNTSIMSQHTIMLENISDVQSKVDSGNNDNQKLLRGICLILANSQQEKLLCNP